MPEGKLICVNEGKYYRWYKSTDHQMSYIPKSNISLAKDLAQKRYITARIQDLTKEKQAILSFNQIIGVPDSNTAEFLESPGISQLLPHYSTLSKELAEWAKADYPHCSKHPEHLSQPNLTGNTLRSKSESFIDTALARNNIPYRYEAPLILNGTTIYPDFTIRHPKTGKTYYWEHIGQLAFPQYRKEFFFKLNLYIENGIIPTIDLITSYEYKDTSFTALDAEEIIRRYFL